MQKIDPIINKEYLILSEKTTSYLIIGFLCPSNSLNNLMLLVSDYLKNYNDSYISIIVQNRNIAVLAILPNPSNNKNNKINSSLYNLAKSLQDINITYLTGYCTYSLLTEGLERVIKNSYIKIKKFDQEYYLKPYKFQALKTDFNDFERMINSINEHRIVFTFKPSFINKQISITLFVAEKTLNRENAIKEIQSYFGTLENLKGELKSVPFNYLKKSLLRTLLGINRIDLKCISVINHISKLSLNHYSAINVSKSPEIYEYKYDLRCYTINNVSSNQLNSSTNDLSYKISKFGLDCAEILCNFTWKKQSVSPDISNFVTKFSNYDTSILILDSSQFSSLIDKNLEALSSGVNFVFSQDGSSIMYKQCISKN